MANSVMKGVVLMLGICFLAGCASIVSSSSRSLPITTQPDEALCEVIDATTGDTIQKSKTPYTALLKAKSGYFQRAKYNIKISKEGYITDEQEISAGMNGWYIGNIIFGGLIGFLIVDPATGAMWKLYEENINVKLYPDTSEGRISMAKEKYNGTQQYTDGDYDAAIKDTDKAISLYPDYAEAYCIRGKSYVHKGEHDKAMEALSKAISINPDYAEALFERGSIYRWQNKVQSARSDITTACEKGFKKACEYKF